MQGVSHTVYVYVRYEVKALLWLSVLGVIIALGLGEVFIILLYLYVSKLIRMLHA